MTEGSTTTELDAEDSKLVVLARGAMGRSGGSEGAAVRDLDGRTYAAASRLRCPAVPRGSRRRSFSGVRRATQASRQCASCRLARG